MTFETYDDVVVAARIAFARPALRVRSAEVPAAQNAFQTAVTSAWAETVGDADGDADGESGSDGRGGSFTAAGAAEHAADSAAVATATRAAQMILPGRPRRGPRPGTARLRAATRGRLASRKSHGCHKLITARGGSAAMNASANMARVMCRYQPSYWRAR